MNGVDWIVDTPLTVMTTRAARAVLIKQNLFLQEFFSCRLESETCVANQTLKDEKCLVPCDGLYADIADDSDNQNMRKGKKSFIVTLYLNTYIDTYIDNLY